MRSAVICFHKNLDRYPTDWINEYRDSILNQSYREFDIIELNYGGDSRRIFENSNFISIAMQDHAQAHNFLVSHCFEAGYDAVFNTNVDDVYPLDRLQLQILNFDPTVAVMSGNYQAFFDRINRMQPTQFHTLNVVDEFSKNHNIIAHPACCYSKAILNYSEFLRSEEIPADDFAMWKRLLVKGSTFKILPNVLMNYRISDLKTQHS